MYSARGRDNSLSGPDERESSDSARKGPGAGNQDSMYTGMHRAEHVNARLHIDWNHGFVLGSHYIYMLPRAYFIITSLHKKISKKKSS